MRVRLEEEKQERENQTLQMKEKLKEKESQLEIQTRSMRERLKEKEQELAAEVMKREVIKSGVICNLAKGKNNATVSDPSLKTFT